jgi:hypothetical protein
VAGQPGLIPARPGYGALVKPGALLVLALAVALIPAAGAGADDRSLREAGRSRDAQFERLGDQTPARISRLEALRSQPALGAHAGSPQPAHSP